MRIAIVGGGYSGASAAVQLLRRSPARLAITIVEPRAEVGYGLAYGADDPDHRLNGTPANHMVDPEDPAQFQRWCIERGLLTKDPDAIASDGSIFVRRQDFGRFVADVVRANAAHPVTGSAIRHVRDVAIDALSHPDSFRVVTAENAPIEADLLIVATGNPLARFPAPFDRELAAHPAAIAAPGDLQRVRAIATDARVLVLGSGLTALDVLSTLVRDGHVAPITVVSRRGLRPRPQRPAPASRADASPGALLERIEGPVAPFILAAGNPTTIRALLMALRNRIREVERDGANWYDAFDDLRDVVWQVWPRLDAREKARFLRKLRLWYDAHRFRAPPQNDAIVRNAERRGVVVFRTARVQSVAVTDGDGPIRVALRERGTQTSQIVNFDTVVNCTGLDPAAGARDNPFLVALINRGLLTIDSSGLGFAVDAQCRAIGANGASCDRLRVVGPPTAGTMGDPLGAIFIAAQIRRALPGIFTALGCR